MILTDAGPLVALIDRAEADHRLCVDALESMRGPLVTTWPAFTEAIYLLGAAAGWHGQQQLWHLTHTGSLAVANLPNDSLSRIAHLMESYQDLPMDLADATLLILAEQTNQTRIFTLDHHFAAYRMANGRHLVVVP